MKKITALVADDSADIQEIFSEILEKLGINVKAKAYNGLEAVDLYQKFRPDIIFLDILMPKYDGLYALNVIKKLDPKARIIVVTADVRKKTRDSIKELGAINLIYKPFKIEDIENTINQIQNDF